MTRPLSNAETTYMPELHQTQPIAVVGKCGWCGIRLAAIPDAPRPYAGLYYHPGGCVSAARGADRGERIE